MSSATAKASLRPSWLAGLGAARARDAVPQRRFKHSRPRGRAAAGGRAGRGRAAGCDRALSLYSVHVGDAGASVLAAFLGRGALPRLKCLQLSRAGIGDAGLVAFAPALRRLPALESLFLTDHPFGDEGLAALVASPASADALPPPQRGLATLKTLLLKNTQVTDAGCAALVAALDSGVLPLLETLDLEDILASDAAQTAVHEALTRSVERAASLPRHTAARGTFPHVLPATGFSGTVERW